MFCPVNYKYTQEDGKLHIVKTQDVEEAIRAIRAVERPKGKNMHYLGSIPNVIALEWAKESGTRLYTKEWLEYAKKKLMSPNYKYLRPL